MPNCKILLFSVVFCFTALTLYTEAAQSSLEPSACYTPGFSDFSEVVIYFTESESNMHNRLLPDILSDQNLAELIKASIKKSFSLCLKDKKSGKEKVITVISSSVEQRDFFHKNSYKLNDVNNLIIAVKRTYVPSDKDMSGFGGYGLIAYDLYRPDSGSAHLESLTSKIGVFFNEGNTPIQSQLESFFKSFGPLMFRGHAPWGSHQQGQIKPQVKY